MLQRALHRIHESALVITVLMHIIHALPRAAEELPCPMSIKRRCGKGLQPLM